MIKTVAESIKQLIMHLCASLELSNLSGHMIYQAIERFIYQQSFFTLHEYKLSSQNNRGFPEILYLQLVCRCVHAQWKCIHGLLKSAELSIFYLLLMA